MKRLILAMLLVLPAWAFAEDEAKTDEPAKAEPAKGDLQVADAKLGTGVADHEIQGEADTFKQDVGKVYLWNKITGGEGTEVSHVWYQGDKKVSEVKLKIKFDSMRTWSYKTIYPGAKGDWHVDVVGPDGAVLKTVSFKVEE
jgi:hypothetical protein